MANELKKIIREAFNTAYKNHKSTILKESVESLKSKMSSGDVYKVENAFREILNNPNLAQSYGWTPQGSANGKLNVKQFNLLAEMINEGTDLETKRNLMMSLYGQENKALYNKAAKRIMSTLNVPVNQKTMDQAYMDGWAQMFLDAQSKSGEVKQNFADVMAKYSASPVVTKTGEVKDSNVGAYIAEILASNMLNAYRDEMSREGSSVSMDAPNQTTGKPSEFGSEEDFGSDTQHSVMGADDLAGLGAGLENPEDTAGMNPELSGEFETGEDDMSSGEEGEDGDEMGNGGETIGAGIEADGGSPAEKEARKMIRILKLSLAQGMKDFRTTGNPTPAQEKGINALETILKTGASPEEVSSKLGYNATQAIQDLKKNKNFVSAIDYYLFTNGFLGPRGKPESFVNMKPLYLSQMVKYMQSNNASHLSPELRESKIWFIENLMLESFIENNLDKIMERVYQKLAPKLNG